MSEAMTLRENEQAIALLKRRCLRCGHKWIKRYAKEPKVCPECKRTDWKVAK